MSEVKVEAYLKITTEDDYLVARLFVGEDYNIALGSLHISLTADNNKIAERFGELILGSVSASLKAMGANAEIIRVPSEKH